MVLAQAAVFLSTLLAMSFLIGRLVVNRLEQMNFEIRKVGRETRDGRVTVEGDDEISELSSQINEMLMAVAVSASEIESQREELVYINESLEQVVRERTNSLEQMNSVLQHALDGIGELTSEGQFLQVNATLGNLLDDEDLPGKYFEDWLSDESKILWHQAIIRLNYDYRVEVELVLNSKASGHQELQCVLIGIGNECIGLETIHIFAKDVTSHRQTQRDMENQIRRDSLTGLGNRTFLNERLEHYLQVQGSTVAIVFVDLDNFKLINDSRGHKVGDLLLRSVAELMTCAADDSIEIARMGGDEFTLLVTGKDVLNRAEAFAIKLQKIFVDPIDLIDSYAFVSCSIGIARGEAGVTSAVDLMRDADTAMYQAKTNGKAGYAIYDDAMNKMVHDRLHLEEGLRTALDNEEMFLVYQPLIDLKTREVIGVEALLRWVHPELGLISPVRFIPVAEETGLIVPIGAWVIEEALRAVKLLEMEYGLSLQMNINLSQRQLTSPSICEFIQEKLKENSVDPSTITLEVTESMAMEDIDGTIEILYRLKSGGVGLAIDDFGTGFSSLSYLQKLPIDKVKIDRAFVQYLGEDERHTDVIEAIIKLCDALDLIVVAEGVENSDQSELLQNLGCPIGQGYLFAKPMNLRALETFLLEKIQSTQAA